MNFNQCDIKVHLDSSNLYKIINLLLDISIIPKVNQITNTSKNENLFSGFMQ